MIELSRDAYERVALVFQGGGALGAYQAGVYQALHESGIEPDWVTGVSIGAINSAIIAGNSKDNRLKRLREFWERITDRTIWHYTPEGDIFRKIRNSTSSYITMQFGQPGFFSPRYLNPWFAAQGASGATSFYDVSPLENTLRDLIDFSLLKEQHIRLSVGAVNVRSGNFIYFDNSRNDIIPEHIIASGSLPPAFPMTKIGTDYYWDGGIVSNTPLQHLLDEDTKYDTLVFQVDLFSSRGNLPRDMQQVMSRHKDITYASRTRYNTDVYQQIRRWKNMTYEALKKIPDQLLTDDDRRLIEELDELSKVTICQLIYQQQNFEGESKDYEFSRTSMEDHWSSGYLDTIRTLNNREWMQPSLEAHGVKIYDVHLERDYSLIKGR